MRLIKITFVTTTTLLLHVLLMCCFRSHITNAWVASSNTGSITRCISGYPSVANGCESKSTGSATSVEPTILGARRQRGLLTLCAFKAVSKEIELTTFGNSTAITDDAQNKVSSDDPASSSSSLELTSEQKIINLVVLAAAFGYAFYTILSIDSGMTRGWSASEIAMRIPLDNWGAYESYLANKPIMTKSLINVIIYLLGDWLSQTAFKDKNLLDFDLSRTLRNGFIGLCFGPLVHEYYEFSDAILPPELGLLTRLQKILMDQTIYLTVKCGVYISAVGLLNGEDWDTVSTTVKEKLGGIILTAWKFWPIVHCVTYSVIPAQHRVLWVNSVDLVWNAIISSAAQKEDQEETVDVAMELSGYVADPLENNANKNGVIPAALPATAASVVFSMKSTNVGSTKHLGGGQTNTTAATPVCVGI